ncbi:MAG: hypothetical protein LH475_08885 [Cryobacterium sp.]|uniref:hypothetical protein n=1 Tax=unclassified Cryobacterium TaxID=2649013 RepID=UPI0018CA6448|nr:MULTISPECIES: hypothetical protein [unclassified Cryobacterium]MCY7404726.1 hypothetical protein [Cryobacterium sp.]MEC5154913.1 hypothetical protein [Cryobacterium sp. CAN_C3]
MTDDPRSRNLLDSRLLSANLDACLITDEEFLAGTLYWSTLADPFPARVFEGAA